MGGTAGRQGWSFAPGRRRAAYTAGTTPRELKAPRMGLVAPLKGAETRPLMRSMSNAEVPCGATNAAAEPRATHPAASASRSGAVQGTNSASSEAEARQRTTRPEVPTSTADDPPRGRRDKRRGIATRRDGESAETPRDAAGIACGAMERDIAAGRGARVVCRGGSRIPGHVIGRSTFYEDDPKRQQRATRIRLTLSVAVRFVPAAPDRAPHLDVSRPPPRAGRARGVRARGARAPRRRCTPRAATFGS